MSRTPSVTVLCWRCRLARRSRRRRRAAAGRRGCSSSSSSVKMTNSKSVMKTGKLIVSHEAPVTCGFGAGRGAEMTGTAIKNTRGNGCCTKKIATFFLEESHVKVRWRHLQQPTTRTTTCSNKHWFCMLRKLLFRDNSHPAHDMCVAAADRQ